MKVSVVLGACCVVFASTAAFAQQIVPEGAYAPQGMAYAPQMLPGGAMYGPMQGGMQGGMPTGYQQFDAQQAMYGPGAPGGGGPMPMDDGSGGMSCPEGCPPKCAECFDDGATHFFYGSLDVFYARRDNAVIRQPTAISTATGLPALSTSDTEFGYEPGVKGQVGYFFGWGFGMEADYWGQFSFASRKGISDPGVLALPGDLGLTSPNFFDVDSVLQTYSSEIDNYEINFVLPYGSWQWIAGFRYMSVDERFDLSTASAVAGSGDYQVIARNRLYGGQIGARGQWEIGRFILDTSVKGGVFANAAHQDQFAVDASGFPIRQTSGDEHQAAFVGEVDANLLIPMGSHLTARLGYEGVWIADLALAPSQLDFTDTSTSGTGVYTRGGILLHGFIAGLDFRW